MLALLIAAAAQAALPSWPAIDQIERRITLPRGAKPLAFYARHYAMSGRNIVTAVYLVPVPPYISRADECEEMTEDFSTRPCDPAKVARSKREAVQAAAREPKPGDRRRYRSLDDLPYINDGGCAQINVSYRLSTGTFLSVKCNGRG